MNNSECIIATYKEELNRRRAVIDHRLNRIQHSDLPDSVKLQWMGARCRLMARLKQLELLLPEPEVLQSERVHLDVLATKKTLRSLNDIETQVQRLYNEFMTNLGNLTHELTSSCL